MHWLIINHNTATFCIKVKSDVVAHLRAMEHHVPYGIGSHSVTYRPTSKHMPP